MAITDLFSQLLKPPANKKPVSPVVSPLISTKPKTSPFMSTAAKTATQISTPAKPPLSGQMSVAPGYAGMGTPKGPTTVPAPFTPQPIPQVKAGPVQAPIAPTIPKVGSSSPSITSPSAPTAPFSSADTGKVRGDESRRRVDDRDTRAAERSVSDAERLYTEAMRLSPDYLSTEADLDRLSEATRKAYTGIENKTIPLEFITGQLKAVEDRALDLAQPLETRLARMEATRQNALEASKFSLERADERLKTEREKAKPLSIGDSLVKLNSRTGEYETVFSAPSEGFTLGEGQRRYDSQGRLIAGIEPGGATGVSTEAQSWADLINKGQAKIGDVPNDIRSQVAAAIASAPSQASPAQRQAQDQASTAITSIDKVMELMTSGGFLDTGNTAFGRVVGQLLPGSEARDLAAQLDTVKALIGFDALAKMREASPTGGALGSITERELRFLQSVQGSLDEGQSSKQLTESLNKIKQSFERLRVLSSPSTSPEEYLQKFPNASDAELEEVIQRYDGAQVSASGNIPQRNNNPGNLKSGGIADKYATGTDNQGHLIFPDPDTGFAALQEDILAKISGNSRNVGPNPTIAQLGRVYAEDPNWSNAVAKMLGVSPSTRTSDIDFDSLIYAIARQEGYYA